MNRQIGELNTFITAPCLHVWRFLGWATSLYRKKAKFKLLRFWLDDEIKKFKKTIIMPADFLKKYEFVQPKTSWFTLARKAQAVCEPA